MDAADELWVKVFGMPRREWLVRFGTEDDQWARRLRHSQRQHERGERSYADHMALVDANGAWLATTKVGG